MKDCPTCEGTGKVCCVDWAAIIMETSNWHGHNANEGTQLQFGPRDKDGRRGLPLWPFKPYENMEMTNCPFCGTEWLKVPELNAPMDRRHRKVVELVK